jgi:flagellar biosynthesis protein FlhB
LRALKIREFAAKYDVPIVENPPVARALFATGEEDQMIPVELYQAVAEILALVFKSKKKKGAA